MPLLPHEEALKSWFTGEGSAAPLVLAAAWEDVEEGVFKTLASKDRFLLEIEKNKRSFSIESVRKMMAACVSTTPFGRRLIIIPGAERLSLPAAQALLKFLEEPTEGNRILLVTKYPKRLLPTIRSRVQILRTNTPDSTPGVESGSGLDLVKLLTSKSRRGLTEEELEAILEKVERRIESGDTGGNTYRALLRLRDYYKIRSLGGNEKLAADVLLASLLELERRVL